MYLPVRVCKIAAVSMVAALLLLASGEVRADLFEVNDLGDAVDAAPGDGVCETVTGNQTCTLRAAVIEANALPGDDEISLPAGTVALTIDGILEDEARTGDLDVTATLEVRGVNRELSRIDGGDLDRIFHILDGELWLRDLTLQNGRAFGYRGGGVFNDSILALSDCGVTSNSCLSGNGGGIFNAGSLLIADCVFEDNEAATGGGVSNAGTATIQRSTFRRNEGHGGALENSASWALAGTTATMMLTDSLFENNRADEVAAAILNSATTRAAAVIDIARSTFTGNISGSSAGALSNEGSSLDRDRPVWDAVARVSDCVFEGNYSDGSGGAIHNSGGFGGGRGIVTIARSNFDSNTSGGDGGAIVSEGGWPLRERGFPGDTSAILTIDESTFRGNSSYSGGAIMARLLSSAADDSILRVSGSTLVDNHALEGSGGAIDGHAGSRSSPGELHIDVVNSTFVDNSAHNDGGAIAAAGETSINNCTLVGNSAPTGSGISSDRRTQLSYANSIFDNDPVAESCEHASSESRGYNLDAGRSCDGATGDIGFSDPMLGPLADNGGLTLTMSPLSGSPAIDAGNPGSADPDLEVCSDVDQRGVSRPQMLGCDIGAVEVGGPEPRGAEVARPDSFLCRRVRVLQSEMAARVASFQDDIHASVARLGRPRMLCSPTGVNGGRINNSTAHLACYQLEEAHPMPRAAMPTVRVADAFGEHEFALRRSRILCVPSQVTD